MAPTPQIKCVLSGSSIKFKCTFKNFDGVITDPSLVKVIIYNYKYEKIKEEILGPTNKIDNGIYFYNYVTNSDINERIYYEWNGEINGFPSIGRGTFITKFI